MQCEKTKSNPDLADPYQGEGIITWAPIYARGKESFSHQFKTNLNGRDRKEFNRKIKVQKSENKEQFKVQIPLQIASVGFKIASKTSISTSKCRTPLQSAQKCWNPCSFRSTMHDDLLNKLKGASESSNPDT